MPRFARIFDAAADVLNAYYQAIADANLDHAMSLWIDEESASYICADGAHMHGLSEIRDGLAKQFTVSRVTIEPVDIRVHDSLSTVAYTVAEAHRPIDQSERAMMVFSTYVLIHERGEWRIAHIHATPMPDRTASQFATKMRHGQGSLH
ncbi:nuclear transport factor 2 family protein [Candidatus Vallotia cooleyia]|uniref:nuclear transport factor 2 family protein n=1 Tax=Candidatus Vallotiella adelgis TaxID=1177211 RepID=UPI001D033F60|nr:nuclear transport factor 2 family protein [Candidatus Vallotia cooleyia]UDG82476.1 hypothetical protein GJV44_00759 [Candidatus Vallotia cooleyia]